MNSEDELQFNDASSDSSTSESEEEKIKPKSCNLLMRSLQESESSESEESINEEVVQKKTVRAIKASGLKKAQPPPKVTYENNVDDLPEYEIEEMGKRCDVLIQQIASDKTKRCWRQRKELNTILSKLVDNKIMSVYQKKNIIDGLK